MKIMLAPGQVLTIGFYEPADPANNAGWHPSEDTPLDGEFKVEFTGQEIKVSADEADDSERQGVIYHIDGVLKGTDEDEEDEEA